MFLAAIETAAAKVTQNASATFPDQNGLTNRCHR